MLCRHGAHHDGNLSTTERDGRVEYPIHAVGDRLSEEFERDSPSGREPISLVAIRCADTPVARETLCKVLERLPLTLDWPARVAVVDRDQAHILIKELPALNSPVDVARDEIDRLASSLLGSAGGSDGNAILVVGHQPTLSRVADALLNGRRPRFLRRAPTPLDRSGIVCVAVADDRPSRRAWIAWAISYDDKAAAAAVRDKIARKMDTAKSFGGLLTLALTIVLGVLVDGQQIANFGHRLWQVQASAVLYLLASGLYIVTMYCYDSLLMPTRFWGESGAGSGQRAARRRWLVERPPSSDAWVLYQNMMRIWRNLFTTASALAFAATVLFAFAALCITGWVAGLSAVAALLVAWWIYRSRPVLGSED